MKSGAPLPLENLLERTTVSIENVQVIQLWDAAMDDLKAILHQHAPEVSVIMPLLWQGSDSKQSRLKELGFPAITLDSYDTTGATPLKVSRHFSPGGVTQIGIGQRPGSPSIPEQLSAIHTKKPIVLLEDDMFTGGTAQSVITLMQEKGFVIIKFIPGLQVSDTLQIRGVPIEAIEKYSSQEVLDVVDPRDFIFGCRDAGLVINDGKLLYRAPYISPWVDIAARASIPAEAAKTFSQDIINMNFEFYKKLDTVIGRRLKLKDTDTAFQTFVTACLNYPLDSTMQDLCKEIATRLQAN